MGGKSKIFDRIESVLSLIAKICTFISGICLIIIVATFGWLVFGRYVLNSTPTWVEQLALLLIVVITFLSSAVGVKERTHLSVEIIPYALPKKMRSLLYILIYLIVAGFGAVMMLEAYNLTAFNWTTEIPLLDVPEGFRTLPAIISGFLLIIFSLGNILNELVSQNRNNSISQENT